MIRGTAIEVPFAQRERLRFVESALLWEGEFTRARVSDVFGVSPNHVTTDLRWYEDQFPKSLHLETRQRCYVAGPEFKPRFASADPAEYLALRLAYAQSGSTAVVPLLGGGDAVPTEALPSPAQGIDRGVLQAAVQAIRHGSGIEITYHSMQAKSPGLRTIWPHALVHTGVRWYVRAFDSSRATFRMFALQRIERPTPVSAPSPQAVEADAAWSLQKTLTVVPHPDLNEHQRRVVAREYGMQDQDGAPSWRVTLRAALIGDFAQRYALDVENPMVPKHRIILKERADLREWLMVNDSRTDDP